MYHATVFVIYHISANSFRSIYYIKVKLLRKLYENIYIFQPQKRIVSAETIRGNTVPIFKVIFLFTNIQLKFSSICFYQYQFWRTPFSVDSF